MLVPQVAHPVGDAVLHAQRSRPVLRRRASSPARRPRRRATPRRGRRRAWRGCGRARGRRLRRSPSRRRRSRMSTTTAHAVFAFVQRGEVGGELLRQHREDPRGRVDGGGVVPRVSSMGVSFFTSASTSATAMRMRDVAVAASSAQVSWSRSRESSLSIEHQARSRRSRMRRSARPRDRGSRRAAFTARSNSGYRPCRSSPRGRSRRDSSSCLRFMAAEGITTRCNSSPAGDRAVLVELGDVTAEELHARASRACAPWPGVCDASPDTRRSM